MTNRKPLDRFGTARLAGAFLGVPAVLGARPQTPAG